MLYAVIVACLCLISTLPVCAQDAASIVRQALLRDHSNLTAQAGYIYEEDQQVQSLDKNGHVKKTESLSKILPFR